MKKILCTIVLALSILLIFTINFKVNASGLRLDLGNNINSINNNENYKWDETTPPKKRIHGIHIWIDLQASISLKPFMALLDFFSNLAY